LKTYKSVIGLAKDLDGITDDSHRLDIYLKLQNEYDIVILSRDDNTKFDLINKLNKTKIEILVNDWCRKGCQDYVEHHTSLSNSISCKYMSTNIINDLISIVDNDHMQILYDIGIRKFKFGGRDNSGEDFLLTTWLYWMSEPNKLINNYMEYHFNKRNNITKNIKELKDLQ
jgi:hypothetical protein